MQANIFPLIIVDVDCDFRLGLALRHLDVGLDYVILTSGRNTLGKFAAAIGYELPLRLLTRSPPNGNGNTRLRMFVRSPYCAVNQSIVIFRGLRSGLNKVKSGLDACEPEGSHRNQEEKESTTEQPFRV